MKTMKFGIIGCGLMGREFASATLRWVHLKDEITKPEIIGVCDMNPASFEWFDKAFPNLKYHFTDYHDLLACEDIEAVYTSVTRAHHGCAAVSCGAARRQGRILKEGSP